MNSLTTHIDIPKVFSYSFGILTILSLLQAFFPFVLHVTVEMCLLGRKNGKTKWFVPFLTQFVTVEIVSDCRILKPSLNLLPENNQ